MAIPLGLLALAALMIILAMVVVYYLFIGMELLVDWIAGRIEHRREQRIAAHEAELERTQDELRMTILRLADALGAEAHEARRAMIRESYRARGELPPPE